MQPHSKNEGFIAKQPHSKNEGPKSLESICSRGLEALDGI